MDELPLMVAIDGEIVLWIEDGVVLIDDVSPSPGDDGGLSDG